MGAKTHDVAIIGAGVCGTAIARALSAYHIKTILIEKCVDVGFGVSKANSGIIHGGFHHKADTLKAKLEIMGNLMFEKLHYELGFPFKRVGILVVAFSEEEMSIVEYLYGQGIANGVEGLEVCNARRLRYLEPHINPDAVGALFAPSGGIIEPYRYVFALAECAAQNGVELRTGFDVIAVEEKSGHYELISENNQRVKAKYVVNAAGLHADKVSRLFKAERFSIHGRKGEEYLLDRNSEAFPNHVLFPLPSKNSKGILVIPTVEGTTMIGPTAEMVEEKDDVSTTAENLEKVFTQAKHMTPSVSRKDIITSFAGTRPALKGNDFYIDISKKRPRFIQVAGVQSPGLTASPAIAEYVKDLLKQAGLKLTEKDSFNPRLEKTVSVRKQSPEQAAQLIDTNPMFGSIVCRCETVSEAEIVEAIRKGHTTLDGIKFYTRAGMGRCQGGFCTYKILKILARETGKDIREFTKRGGGSFEIVGKIGKKD
ncbi:MAG: FAD-dependent oxidoreductase [Chitinivibrionales bacterium]|nr:FAD-dependent oxidoreductase [Chitinivibrionales bacterium]